MNNLIYASAKLGVGIHPQNNSSRNNVTTPRKSKSVGYSSWIASQVPGLLVGIGLAHLGPSSGAVDHAPTSTSSIGVVSGFGSMLGQRSKVLMDYIANNSSSTSNLNETSPSPGKSVLKFGKARDYRSFTRVDIEKWRAQFRPEVEDRFNSMEKARQKWKEKESVKERKKEMEIKEPVPNTPAIAPLTLSNLAIRNHISEKTELTRLTSGGTVTVNSANMKSAESESMVMEEEDEDEDFAMSTILAANIDMFKPKLDIHSAKNTDESRDYTLDNDAEPEIWPDREDLNAMNAHRYSEEDKEEVIDYQRQAVEAIVRPLRQHSMKALDALNKGINVVDIDQFVSPLGDMIAGKASEYVHKTDVPVREEDFMIYTYQDDKPARVNNANDQPHTSANGNVNNRQHRRLNGK